MNQTLSFCLALALLLIGWTVAAEEPDRLQLEQQPIIAIIIDDMGNRLVEGSKALDLPGAVTFAFLPHTPYARKMAEQAHTTGKEVMLHLPMDAHSGKALGPGGLSLHMTEQQFQDTLASSLAAVPHVTGLNNHMGSLLTQHPGAMDWLMQDLQRRGNLFFVDSRTTSLTVAEQLAHEHQIPVAGRDVFLDNLREPEYIRQQFQQLIRRAKVRGKAIGIGHPFPETIAILAEELQQLEGSGVKLVFTSEIIATDQRNIPWQASLSPSPKEVKSSKPPPSSTCCEEPVLK
jgi:polysaccharide deacetylase 2 family uncharacterized protein YibQ